MAISPITSVLHRSNNLQQISFEKKEKKTNVPDTRSSVMSKAIPSAALVLATMSPGSVNAAEKYNNYENENNFEVVLSRQEAKDNSNLTSLYEAQAVAQDADKIGGKILDSRKISNLKDVTILLVNTNGDNKTINKVLAKTMTSKGYYAYLPIQKIANYKVSLYSDDGKKDDMVKHSEIFRYVEPQDLYIKLYNDEILNYVKENAKNLDKNFKIETYERNMRVDKSISYWNYPGEPKNKLKSAVPLNYDPAKFINVGEQDYTTQEGTTYKIRYYSNDGNDDNAERVTLQWDGNPEVEVRHNFVLRANFMPGARNAFNIDKAGFALADGENNIYIKIDTEMGEILHQIHEDKKQINWAFMEYDETKDFNFTERGAVYEEIDSDKK